MNGCGSDRRAGVGGDLLGGGVGHLAGEAALLDLEVRDVAGGEDARDDAAVGVGDEEAVLVARQARDRRAFEHRQRDDALDVEQPGRPGSCSVCSSMPPRSSRSRIRVWNSSSGSASGVTKCSSALMPISYARPASISASS